MLNTKGMRFPIDVIFVCIRWYAAYPLSYRHLEEMMEERGVQVDHSTIRPFDHSTIQPFNHQPVGDSFPAAAGKSVP
jgi:transposase-like protein